MFTASEAAAKIRAGMLAPIDLVEQCVARIHERDGQIRAWVAIDEASARAAARRLTDEAGRGNWRGPLHGVPIGIKDIIDVAGYPTRAGSPLRADAPPAAADAPLVAALRRAGAIVLGKTVTVEYASFDPPPTRNPWDPNLQHTPGGSSSGSAAAVAAGMCLAALGTQTGGSLVRPASYCGIATCKPTFGRLSTEGIIPLSIHFDHPGPMAQTVADLSLLLRCMIPLSDNETPPRSTKPRLALIENFFLERADKVVLSAVETAVAKLIDRGARVERIRLDVDFQRLLDIHLTIMAVDAAAYHREQFAAHRSGYGPMLAKMLDYGLSISAVDYAAAMAELEAFRGLADRLVGDYDALLAPSTDTTAPATLTTTGPRDFQAPWSCSGLPVVSLPCEVGSDGMPVAVQLVGRADQESSLLDAASWCERCFDFPYLVD